MIFRIALNLDTIMLADDKDIFFIFFEYKILKTLFSTANKDLRKVWQWFITGKTNFSENLPLILPTLQINDNVIERVQSIKCLGVSIFERSAS